MDTTVQTTARSEGNVNVCRDACLFRDLSSCEEARTEDTGKVLVMVVLREVVGNNGCVRVNSDL